MRELKFRVWSEEDKQYRTDCDVFKLFHGKTGCPATIYSDEGDRFDIEQYTGLKDKNGKEIYEGDIVEQFVCGVHQFKGKECGRKTLWQVRWNEEECCFELHYLSGSLFGDSMMSNSDEYEVIGTIHENPELLEEK